MGLTQDQKDALEVHNKGREAKHLKPLEWDEKCTQGAQKWAEHLATVVHGLQHSTSQERPDEGENLWGGYSSQGEKHPFTQAAEGWMSEGKDYHGEKIGQTHGEVGHYTQCMWDTTTKVGMAMATASNGWVYVVGRYNPPGNWVGKTPYPV